MRRQTQGYLIKIMLYKMVVSGEEGGKTEGV